MDVLVPATLEEALELRRARPEAVPVAGGTDLFVEVNSRRCRPPALLDLSRVEELKEWRLADGVVRLGAGVTFARIADELTAFPPLVAAARSVGSVQIRNRATVGGNLATASPAGDSLPVLAAYDAKVELAAAGGRRRLLPLDAFLLGPKRTRLAHDELISAVEWTAVTGHGSFAKIGRRNAMVIAVASACLQLDEERREVRLALGSVAPTVVRARRAEEFAEGLDWSDVDAAPEWFGQLAAADTRPIDDLRGTAAYRRLAARVLASRALSVALEARC
jgi:CO/xanthine dehydrogenase FAD-binding subunit